MTWEVEGINDLEQILDIFQNIRDREIGRRSNLSGVHNNENHNHNPVSYTHLDVYKRQLHNNRTLHTGVPIVINGFQFIFYNLNN